MGLAVHDQRIDAAADVVDRGVARELDDAGVGIDLDLADRAAVRKHRIVHLVVGGDGEAVLELVRQLSCAASFASSRKSKLRLLVGDENRPSLNSTLSAGASSTSAAICLPLAIRSAAAFAITVAGVAHRAAGVRAAADADDVGVADDDVDRLDRHRDQVGDHLREARLVALAARLRADHHVDAAVRASP